MVVSASLLSVACGLPRAVRSPAPAVNAWRGSQVWQKDIDAFAETDRTSPPPGNAALFMGSSSIRMWDLKKYFTGIPVVNRGFGGSYISDSAYYAGRIAAPCKPRVIVLYAGDNDITDGKPPERVAADFNDFTGAVRAGSPGVPVIYISIKPSPSRWKLWPKMLEANALIKRSCEARQPCRFLDVGPSMLGADGMPRPELFQPDGLHMTDQGYRLWTDMLTPLLTAP